MPKTGVHISVVNYSTNRLKISDIILQNSSSGVNLSVFVRVFENLYLCRFTILFQAYEIRCGKPAAGVYWGQSTSDRRPVREKTSKCKGESL